jgi:hypothetical protein
VDVDITEDGLPILQAGSAPYGNVTYADPGYQKDKKKRYPLNNEKRVRAAWSYINMPKNAKKYSSSQLASIKSKIRSAAKRYGIDISQEISLMDKELVTTLILQEDGTAGAVILQEPTAEGANGVMRVRVPFYRGGSLTKAPGFTKRIFFGRDILPALVQEGNRDLEGGKHPLTVYARHAHATSGRDLPIGGVVGLEHDGSDGYGILEIVPTSNGRDAQLLLQSKHVNSVSLRSGSDYELEPGKINGESVLVAKKLRIAGIDLAPEGPAQDTYGIQILNENVQVEADTEVDPDGTGNRRNRRNNLDPITLEEVPQDVRAQIESPIRTELEQAKADNVRLTQEIHQRDLDAFIAEVASSTPEPDKTRQVLQDLVKEKGYTTREQLAPVVLPLLLEANAKLRANGATTVVTLPAPEPSASDKLRDMFAPKPAGSGTVVTQEGDGGATPNGNGKGDQPVMLEDGKFEFATGGLAIPVD